MKNPTETVSQAIEGFFIPFASSDIEDIRKALTEDGYTPDGQGLRELVLDTLFREEKERESYTDEFIRKSQNYININPEKIKAGIDLAVSLVNMLGNKLGNKKPSR